MSASTGFSNAKEASISFFPAFSLSLVVRPFSTSATGTALSYPVAPEGECVLSPPRMLLLDQVTHEHPVVRLTASVRNTVLEICCGNIQLIVPIRDTSVPLKASLVIMNRIDRLQVKLHSLCRSTHPIASSGFNAEEDAMNVRN